MKYFLDTEFLEDGHTIELISIGIVAEDGREYYAVHTFLNLGRILAEPWLLANVVPHLPLTKQFEKLEWTWANTDKDFFSGLYRNRAEMKAEILAFVGNDSQPEFWGYYADYNWVAFCQLFGRMIDLPRGFPKFCRDLKQFCVDVGNPTLPIQNEDEHNALADARWNKRVYDFLLEKQRLVPHGIGTSITS